MMIRPGNLVTLAEMLPVADKNGFAVGSFTARSLILIKSILQSAEDKQSPIIIMVAYNEAIKRGMGIYEFAKEVYDSIKNEGITVPVCLHLDHTMVFDSIKTAIDAGFTSVMIDASQKSFDENIEITRQVKEYAGNFGVSVEGELGRILSHGTDEIIEDTELYTDPRDAQKFVEKTKVDALAVSVGTQHGVYNMVKDARIDFDRLRDIKAHVNQSIVLHGGSGIDKTMIKKAIQMEGGGVSKINIATEVEQEFLNAVGAVNILSHTQIMELPPQLQKSGQSAVYDLVGNKLENYLLSSGKAFVR